MHHIHPQHILQHLVDPLLVKANFVPKLANNFFQNLEVKFASLSYTIFFGTPFDLIISLMKTFATCFFEYIDSTRMKCATFVNSSTMIMMGSCCLYVHGNDLPLPLWNQNWLYSPLGCLHSTFTC